ncbi:DEAD/DEAH box helicase family protein [Methanogenium sp. S4BF]|uniref:type III restriction-modification system endonuclease n=1 Tax=Methanogenium sp. S4BF TaxID=1789226 RepID=UPI002416B784|nr:DEAD/DEAH box helicase family protein [Methanogenium sp. S4BF]WFN33469.1 DEAD/DEAH box helicase family protein [Methanogenium sp. S4BF]
MKLQFKHQAFQAEAAQAVCDVFAGQPRTTPTYLIDTGLIEKTSRQIRFGDGELVDEDSIDSTGYRNSRIKIADTQILQNLQKIQRDLQIEPSKDLEGTYNLTIEMETGVGKTYTYIKTMYEMNKRFGFTKFIIVVPSIAIREGVYKSFELTEDHFAEDYGKKIRYFIYNSKQLHKLEQFANDSSIHVMIINSQAFNARGKDARRIYMQLDSFRSRKPIDVIAQTNPVVIIDEPQSVEGAATKERLKEFNPLMTLRYSATHKKNETYNMVYRLDALEAYNKRLVKKIAVKGISVTGSTGTEGYLYLEGLNFSKSAPTASLEFECKGKNSLRKVSRNVTEGYNLYEHSGELNQYQGYVVSEINGLTNSVSFTNGVTITAGEMQGLTDEEQIRRIQIRETIKSHLERERALFKKGIKVLSLFFIDEVAKYRQYDDSGEQIPGEYAQIFEEEYRSEIENLTLSFGEDDYLCYLKQIKAEETHQGYFSIDKKGKYVDSSAKGKENVSDDVDAYDLIMKKKEQLLDHKEPVRFIFSHSALREGWDNPNVFQICTLKTSSSEVRKRQEVGRGLRLCVNNLGERMDTNVLGGDVHNVNVLTVIANESYDSFAKALQSEMADAIADRPRIVDARLFEGRVISNINGAERIIDPDLARKINNSLIRNCYVDDDCALTVKYHEDAKNGNISLPEEINDYSGSIIEILGNIGNPDAFRPDDARSRNVDLKIVDEKLEMKEFKSLWERINSKSAYIVDFDSNELVEKSIAALDEKLRVKKIFYRIESGAQVDTIQSKESVAYGESFIQKEQETTVAAAKANSSVKYDLIGEIAKSTKLTRKDVAAILQGIKTTTFDQFKGNPEEFIIQASKLIDEQKATVIVEHIEYHILEDRYDTGIFTEPSMKRGTIGKNAIPADKSLYNYIITDSGTERKFAEKLDTDTNVAVYVKLPNGFYINTPVGKYNPDWAIAFKEGTVKHIYFVAETKGDLSSMQLRKIESLKIQCAREHFRSISSDSVKYEVVTDYHGLLNEVMT